MTPFSQYLSAAGSAHWAVAPTTTKSVLVMANCDHKIVVTVVHVHDHPFNHDIVVVVQALKILCPYCGKATGNAQYVLASPNNLDGELLPGVPAPEAPGGPDAGMSDGLWMPVARLLFRP